VIYNVYFIYSPNYEAKNVRLNSVTGWCGKQEAFTYVSVDMGQVFRVKVKFQVLFLYKFHLKKNIYCFILIKYLSRVSGYLSKGRSNK
jgi:hypothetical protein